MTSVKSIISLAMVMAFNMHAQQLHCDRASYVMGQPVTVTYSDLAPGATIALYKGLSYQPMRYVECLEQEAGIWTYPEVLEPANYDVRCIDQQGELLAATTFHVTHQPSDLGGYRIVLLSDIHVMAPSLLVSEGSAFDNHVATDRKMLRQSAEIFTTMVDSIITIRPDLVLIAGDLTKDGETASHQYVARELHRMRLAGIPTRVIPGNHDCNNPGAKSYDGDNWEYAPTVTRDQFAELYTHYGYGDDTEREPTSLSYVCEPLPGLVLLALDSNEDEENTLIVYGDESNSAKVGGRIKPETLEWACEQLHLARSKGKQVLVMLHHHLVPHFDKEESLLQPYLLENAAMVQQRLLKAGANVILTGHFHVQDISQTYNEQRTDSLTEVSSGALVGYPHPFRLLNFNEDATQLQLTTGYISHITSMPDLEQQSQAVLARCIPSMMRTHVTLYWPRVISKLVEKLGSMEVVDQLMDLPPNASEAAVLANQYLEDPARRTYMLMTEGNEHLKKTDDLRADVMAGMDSLVNAIVKPPYRAALRAILLDEVNQRFGPVFDSVYGDINQVGTAHECQFNDLFLTLKIKGIHSAVRQVSVERRVALVQYVNLAGQRSAKPWQGINIVVTRYTDGTTKSERVIM